MKTIIIVIAALLLSTNTACAQGEITDTSAANKILEYVLDPETGDYRLRVTETRPERIERAELAKRLAGAQAELVILNGLDLKRLADDEARRIHDLVQQGDGTVKPWSEVLPAEIDRVEEVIRRLQETLK